MTQSPRSGTPDILPVPRSSRDARRYYDRLSRVYDCLTAAYEKKLADRCLDRLAIQAGENVLEIGFGSGHCLTRIAVSVGGDGRAHGLDISSGMLRSARAKLRRSGLLSRAQLYCGDAVHMPFAEGSFDAVFMSYTLELFDTPDIPRVLARVKTALKPGGRLAVASMSKANGMNGVLRLYEWGHRRWPTFLDCRPIYPRRSLEEAGFDVAACEEARAFGFPTEIVLAYKLQAQRPASSVG
jgi:demethylmenaquinone methyltransferase/2-methoxy-6-polyprenyl-1,4-benzoquinol methylase